MLFRSNGTVLNVVVHNRDINAHFKHFGFWLREEQGQSGSRSLELKRLNLVDAGTIKQKAPNSNGRKSRAVS